MDAPNDIGGGRPDTPGVETRVIALEADMRDVKGSLVRLDTNVGRLETNVARLETNVARLETTVARLETTVERLERSISRIEDTLSGLVTNMAVALERIAGLDARLTRVEDKLGETVKVAMSKVLSPWQMPAVLAACLGVVSAAVAATAWVATHFGVIPH